MDGLKQYFKDNIISLIRKRQHEIKIGETINFCGTNFNNDLKNDDIKFVIIGIPEDIGVRANYGRGGANTAFKPALESFLNLPLNDNYKRNQINKINNNTLKTNISSDK